MIVINNTEHRLESLIPNIRYTWMVCSFGNIAVVIVVFTPRPLGNSSVLCKSGV